MNQLTGSPLFGVPLQTQFYKGVEVWGEGAAVGVVHRGGRGLPVRVAGPSGPGALADARVCPGTGRLHGQLLWRDGGGVQQTRDCPIQLLQQHLGYTGRGGGERRRGKEQ